MAIVLTQKAVDQLMNVIREQGWDPTRTYLRVAYHPRAQREKRCSIELQEHKEPDSPADQIIDSAGVQVRCDSKSYHYVKGITIDYHDTQGAQGFTITRPPSKWPDQSPWAAPWIYDALRTVIDPEIGLNIVDLGLIYETCVEGSIVTVIMTMTTPACPMTEMIIADVKASLLRAAANISTVNVELVWDPPWVPEMVSEDGRNQMGWQ
ncbi:MAG: DUF59 domain-containing protein [Phycisphaerales bacterium]|nr:DUF59 domain-containing protein [Phycisphaerales bacterium]